MNAIKRLHDLMIFSFDRLIAVFILILLSLSSSEIKVISRYKHCHFVSLCSYFLFPNGWRCHRKYRFCWDAGSRENQMLFFAWLSNLITYSFQNFEKMLNAVILEMKLATYCSLYTCLLLYKTNTINHVFFD